MKGIVSAFTETENRNLRIIRSWVFSFKKIYATTTKFYKNSKYYEDILNDFLHYSIWVAGALKKNKKITHSANYGSQDMACFEGHEYNYILDIVSLMLGLIVMYGMTKIYVKHVSQLLSVENKKMWMIHLNTFNGRSFS